MKVSWKQRALLPSCRSAKSCKWLAQKRLLIPPGFAHGFLVTSGSAEFLYKTTDYWYPEHERSLLWCDPTVGVQWPVDGEPKLAAKDAAGKVLAEADCFS